MISSLPNRLRAWFRNRTSRVLDPQGRVGELSNAEHETIHALLQAITGDSALHDAECRRFVNEKTGSTPGVLDAYRQATLLLEESSHRHLGQDFSKASMAERDRLLRRILIQFPHDERLPRWVRRARLSPRKLSLLLEAGPYRSLRHHVMPELLSWHYTTERGWAVVGWKDFPGKARES